MAASDAQAPCAPEMRIRALAAPMRVPHKRCCWSGLGRGPSTALRCRRCRVDHVSRCARAGIGTPPAGRSVVWPARRVGQFAPFSLPCRRRGASCGTILSRASDRHAGTTALHAFGAGSRVVAKRIRTSTRSACNGSAHRTLHSTRSHWRTCHRFVVIQGPLRTQTFKRRRCCPQLPGGARNRPCARAVVGICLLVAAAEPCDWLRPGSGRSRSRKAGPRPPVERLRSAAAHPPQRAQKWRRWLPRDCVCERVQLLLSGGFDVLLPKLFCLLVSAMKPLAGVVAVCVRAGARLSARVEREAWRHVCVRALRLVVCSPPRHLRLPLLGETWWRRRRCPANGCSGAVSERRQVRVKGKGHVCVRMTGPCHESWVCCAPPAEHSLPQGSTALAAATRVAGLARHDQRARSGQPTGDAGRGASEQPALPTALAPAEPAQPSPHQAAGERHERWGARFRALLAQHRCSVVRLTVLVLLGPRCAAVFRGHAELRGHAERRHSEEPCRGPRAIPSASASAHAHMLDHETLHVGAKSVWLHSPSAVDLFVVVCVLVSATSQRRAQRIDYKCVRNLCGDEEG